MTAPDRRDVWLVDLGMAGKARPCPVLSVRPGLQDRALTTVVAGTTSLRGTRFEVSVQPRFLQAGVFDAQNMLTVPHAKLVRKLDVLPSDQLVLVEQAVRNWLGL
jgi:mRNA interferase MazF